MCETEELIKALLEEKLVFKEKGKLLLLGLGVMTLPSRRHHEQQHPRKLHRVSPKAGHGENNPQYKTVFQSALSKQKQGT